MKIHAALLALVCCAVLAVPAAAFAQSPTGDTYGGVAGQQTVNTAVAGNETNPPTSTGGGNSSLPFTGFELGLAALVGTGLLGFGLVLRRTVRQQAGA